MLKRPGDRDDELFTAAGKHLGVGWHEATGPPRLEIGREPQRSWCGDR